SRAVELVPATPTALTPAPINLRRWMVMMVLRRRCSLKRSTLKPRRYPNTIVGAKLRPADALTASAQPPCVVLLSPQDSSPARVHRHKAVLHCRAWGSF